HHLSNGVVAAIKDVSRKAIRTYRQVPRAIAQLNVPEITVLKTFAPLEQRSYFCGKYVDQSQGIIVGVQYKQSPCIVRHERTDPIEQGRGADTILIAGGCGRPSPCQYIGKCTPVGR